MATGRPTCLVPWPVADPVGADSPFNAGFCTTQLDTAGSRHRQASSRLALNRSNPEGEFSYLECTLDEIDYNVPAMAPSASLRASKDPTLSTAP